MPGARDQAGRGELAFGTIDTWLLWQLTGGAVHATDVSNASRTLMRDVHNNQWDDTLLRAVDIPRELLPDVHPSGHAFGDTAPGLLRAAVPVGGMAGDQQSALFGQACFRPGLAKNTYGTGCFMLMHTGTQFQISRNGLITTSAAQPGPTPEFALEGSVFIGGAVVQWLRDGPRAIQGSARCRRWRRVVGDNYLGRGRQGWLSPSAALPPCSRGGAAHRVGATWITSGSSQRSRPRLRPVKGRKPADSTVTAIEAPDFTYPSPLCRLGL